MICETTEFFQRQELSHRALDKYSETEQLSKEQRQYTASCVVYVHSSTLLPLSHTLSHEQ